MRPVARLGRGLNLGLVVLAAAGVVLLSLADPGSLLSAAPLALAFALLLAGRRQENLSLILCGNILAIASIAVLAVLHLRQ